MSRTLSKEKKYRKSCTILNQRTQKKTVSSLDVSSVVKSSIWVNNKKISLLIQEGGKSQSFFNEIKYFDTKTERKYLRIANPINLRINRARIFDWLLDVCRGFWLRWQTYWCAIQLLDFLIFVIDSVKVNNILINAVTCLFMASKMHEKDPPYLRKLIQKAVYNAFSESQVLNLQASILLKTANSQTKPRHLYSVYNILYQIFPKIAQKARIQAIRRLILIWMDPVLGLNCKKKYIQNQMGQAYVSYEDLVVMTVKGIEDGEQDGSFNEVYIYFKGKYECDNLSPGWPGFLTIRQ